MLSLLTRDRLVGALIVSITTSMTACPGGGGGSSDASAGSGGEDASAGSGGHGGFGAEAGAAGTGGDAGNAGAGGMGPGGAQFTLNEGTIVCPASTASTTMIRVGGDCSISVSVDYLQGEFDEPVVLSVDGLRPGVTAEFSYVTDVTGVVPGTGAVLYLHFRGVAEAGPVELIVTGTTAAHGSDTFTIPLTITSRPGFPLASVAVGRDITCGVDASGQGFCWGSNSYGELGIGTIGSSEDYKRMQPTAVVGGVSFSKIASPGGRTCGLDTNGKAHCWGKGWLGDGDVTLEPRTAPGPVDGDLSFVELVAGGPLVCGLTGSGEIYCWGGANGGLGNGTYDGASVPTNIAAGRSYVALAASDSATCALADEGSVYCWGNNTYGQLGPGSTEDHLSPVAVVTSLTFKAIAMSFDSTCGLTDEGTAHCWGTNSAGNLGLGAFDSDPHPSPEAVSGGLVFSTLVGGSGGFCGLDPNGEVYCWGFAGSEDHTAVSAPTLVSGEVIFSQIAVGHDMNCGIATNGLAATYCWMHGFGNSDGYLGTGDTEDYVGPVPIAEP